MKVFIAFRYTGENLTELEPTLTRVRDALIARGHTVYCSFWDEAYFQEQSFTRKHIYEYTTGKIETSDVVFALIKTNDVSQSMLLEIGFAYAQEKPLILAIQQHASAPTVEAIAAQVIRYETIDDLCQTLQTIDLIA